jgi:hypothetical protein
LERVYNPDRYNRNALGSKLGTLKNRPDCDIYQCAPKLIRLSVSGVSVVVRSQVSRQVKEILVDYNDAVNFQRQGRDIFVPVVKWDSVEIAMTTIACFPSLGAPAAVGRRMKARSIFRFTTYGQIGTFTAIGDYLLIVVASVLASASYHFFMFDLVGNVAAFIVIGNYSALIFVLITYLRGKYQPQSLHSIQTRELVFAWTVVLLFITSLLFLLKIGEHISRGSIILFSICGFAFLIGSRAAITTSLRKALANGTLIGEPA